MEMHSLGRRWIRLTSRDANTPDAHGSIAHATYAQPAVICTSTGTHRYCVIMDASVVYFLSFMFAPNGFTVVATYPDGTSKGIAVLDSKAHAIDYAKGCDSIYAPILERTVYTVKQNYPTSAYTY